MTDMTFYDIVVEIFFSDLTGFILKIKNNINSCGSNRNRQLHLIQIENYYILF